MCGLDYFGHVNYVEGRSTKKAWDLLFTCISSRSVHVEVVTSLSLKDFLLAFSRFNDVWEKVEVTVFFRTMVPLSRLHPRHSQTY